MENEKKPNQVVRVATRVVICALLLIAGVMAMKVLIGMKKPPVEANHKERTLKVEVLTVVSEDVEVFITGSGEARAKDVVALAPEVGGRVVRVNAWLEAGQTILRGSVLFAIDPTNYKSASDIAESTVRQAQSTIQRLEKQYEIDSARQKTLERNRELANDEYKRVRDLFENKNVGTRSGVDQAESAFNSAADIADQIARAVELCPIQIQEAKSGLESARARLTTAKADLNRTIVKAPFDGRVVSANMERGQFVQPGFSVVTLADDSMLEILVPIDSRDARDWLRFENQAKDVGGAWFSGLLPVKCKIRWTEDKNNHFWEGVLDRVVRFDNKTRTLIVTVRVSAANAISKGSDSLPLVEGMFCKVDIPGKTMKHVMRMPRWAVSFKNTVYVNQDGRLKTVPVTVVRVQGEYAFVSSGLKDGDQVIITRLTDPLENSLLEIISQGHERRES